MYMNFDIINNINNFKMKIKPYRSCLPRSQRSIESKGGIMGLQALSIPTLEPCHSSGMSQFIITVVYPPVLDKWLVHVDSINDSDSSNLKTIQPLSPLCHFCPKAMFHYKCLGINAQKLIVFKFIKLLRGMALDSRHLY